MASFVALSDACRVEWFATPCAMHDAAPFKAKGAAPFVVCLAHRRLASCVAHQLGLGVVGRTASDGGGAAVRLPDRPIADGVGHDEECAVRRHADCAAEPGTLDAATVCSTQTTKHPPAPHTGINGCWCAIHPGAHMTELPRAYRPLYPDKATGDRGLLHQLGNTEATVAWPANAAPPVVAVFSEKGGVNKTATTTGLAAVAAAAGLPVLVVDMDPSATATDELGLHVYDPDKPDYAQEALDRRGVELDVVQQSINTVLSDENLNSDDPLTVDDVICSAGPEWPAHVHVLPSEARLENRESHPPPALVMRLRVELQAVIGDYAMVLIDMPPRVGGMLEALAIAAATHSITPATLNEDGIQGAKRALRSAKRIRASLGLPAITQVGVLRTMVPGQYSKIAAESDQQLWQLFHQHKEMPLLEHIAVPQAVVRQDARSFSTPITEARDEVGLRVQWAYARALSAIGATLT